VQFTITLPPEDITLVRSLYIKESKALKVYRTTEGFLICPRPHKIAVRSYTTYDFCRLHGFTAAGAVQIAAWEHAHCLRVDGALA
jgi:hypothetical protein